MKPLNHVHRRRWIRRRQVSFRLARVLLGGSGLIASLYALAKLVHV